jgi:hypothetical protein
MPKRKAQSDWRESLFFWRGVLTSNDAPKHLTWRGAWVSSTSSEPEDVEYTASENTFISALDLNSELKGITLASFKSAPVTGSITSKYLLDQGDGNGLQEYEDIKQTFATSILGDKVFITALGSTEFGSFVSCGTLTETEDGTLTLLLVAAISMRATPGVSWRMLPRSTHLAWSLALKRVYWQPSLSSYPRHQKRVGVGKND